MQVGQILPESLLTKLDERQVRLALPVGYHHGAELGVARRTSWLWQQRQPIVIDECTSHGGVKGSDAGTTKQIIHGLDDLEG